MQWIQGILTVLQINHLFDNDSNQLQSEKSLSVPMLPCCCHPNHVFLIYFYIFHAAAEILLTQKNYWLLRMHNSCNFYLFLGISKKGTLSLREHKIWPQIPLKPLHIIFINLSLLTRRSRLLWAIEFPSSSCWKLNLCADELWNVLPWNTWNINRGVEDWLKKQQTLEHKEEVVFYVTTYSYNTRAFFLYSLRRAHFKCYDFVREQVLLCSFFNQK